MLRTKKGISPIIAAVILIAIVVAIGALVANFIRSYTNAQQENVGRSDQAIRCATDVTLKAVEVEGFKARCTQANTVVLNIQNAGSADITDLTFNVIGTTTASSKASATQGWTGLIAGAIDDFTLTANDQSTIIVVPTIQLPGNKEATVCAESGFEIVASEISTCPTTS